VTRFLYDTAIFVYAVGAEHRYREPCRQIVAAAGAGILEGEASVGLVEELTHVMLRKTRDRGEAVEVGRAAAQLCRLHDFEQRDLPLAMSLFARHSRLGIRDAVFAATALNRGVPLMLSPDTAFDDVDGLRRIDPLDAAGVATLSA
jgi:predicted nucleic acid-binding protein